MSFSSLNADQNSYGALKAVRNLLRPSSWYTFGSSEYDQIAARTKKDRNRNRTIQPPLQCSPSNSATHPMNTMALTSLMRATRNSACSCKPWGSCTTDVCSCNQLCPNNFNIFKKAPYQNSTKDLTAPENSLAFRNSGAMKYSPVKGTQGYCWGHASVTSKFNRLGFFNENDKAQYNRLKGAPNTRARASAISYYKRIIDDIMDNKVRTIPGFKNLKELSAHPDFQSYMAMKTTEAWGKNAMSAKGLTTAMGSTPMEKEDSIKFVDQIVDKLNNHQQPQIVFTKAGSRFETHTILISHYEKKNGATYLCARDNNYYPNNNKSCQYKIYRNTKGSITYSAWGELGSVTLAHNDHSDGIEQYKALLAHCKKSKGCRI